METVLGTGNEQDLLFEGHLLDETGRTVFRSLGNVLGAGRKDSGEQSQGGKYFLHHGIAV